MELKGFGLDGKLSGTLQVRDQPGRPALATGTLEARGRYTAYGQALTIRRSRLTYAKSSINNPALDIVAERNFEDVTVGIRVQGTARSPQTTITSSPAMEASEALSWLVLGRPLNTASRCDSQRLDATALFLTEKCSARESKPSIKRREQPHYLRPSIRSSSFIQVGRKYQKIRSNFELRRRGKFSFITSTIFLSFPIYQFQEHHRIIRSKSHQST